MRMKVLLSLAAWCAFPGLTSNFAVAQKLYPVHGPLAEQTPPQVFQGHIRRPIVATGPVFNLLKSWTLADGDVSLTGKVQTITATSAIPSPAKTVTLPLSNLAFAWDAVYGDGFFVAHVLGKKFDQAVFTGTQGTVLQVESVDGRNGVAIDNKGNTYKLVWQ
jgi:hypothetical protein